MTSRRQAEPWPQCAFLIKREQSRAYQYCRQAKPSEIEKVARAHLCTVILLTDKSLSFLWRKKKRRGELLFLTLLSILNPT